MQAFSFYFSLPPHNKIVKFLHPEPTRVNCANSGVLSIVACIIENFPQLAPPTLSPEQIPHKLDASLQEPWEAGLYHPFQGVWTDYVNDLICQCSAVRHENVLYLQIPLRDQEPVGLLSQNFIQEVGSDQPTAFERIKKIFDLPDVTLQTRKIGYFFFPYKNQAKALQPRILTDGLFIGHLYQNEPWKIIYVTNGQVPSPEELAQYHCLVAPGSALSVYDLPKQVKQIRENLLVAQKLNSALKYFGVCFGHQLLCTGLGMKVDKKPRAGGMAKVTLNRQVCQEWEFLKPIADQKTYYLSVHHEDFIQEVPLGYQVIATNERCKIEGLVSDDGRTLTTQFHSEFFPQYTSLVIKKMIYYFGKFDLMMLYMPSSKQIEEKTIEDSMKWLTAICEFINHE